MAEATQCSITSSEQQVFQAIEMAAAAYVLTDAWFRLLEVNPALCKLTGYSRQELLGQDITKVIPDCPHFGALLMQKRVKEMEISCCAVRHREGHYVQVQHSCRVTRDASGAVLSYNIFLSDTLESTLTHSLTEATGDIAGIRTALKNSLSRVLDHEEFAVYYQPRINLNTMKISGIEALMRWKHPRLGYVSPTQFIPIAEENGLMDAVGQWVLEEACGHILPLLSRLEYAVRLSVNLAKQQLKSPGLVPQIEMALKQIGFPPHLLELEVDESALIFHDETSIKIVNDLTTLGVMVSVHDFRIGHSSLPHAKRFGIGCIKFDQNSVEREDTKKNSHPVLAATINMAHTLDIKVIAKGVETMPDLQQLKDLGCDEVQGYILAKPMPINELQEFLSHARTDTDGFMSILDHPA